MNNDYKFSTGLHDSCCREPPDGLPLGQTTPPGLASQSLLGVQKQVLNTPKAFAFGHQKLCF